MAHFLDSVPVLQCSVPTAFKAGRTHLLPLKFAHPVEAHTVRRSPAFQPRPAKQKVALRDAFAISTLQLV